MRNSLIALAASLTLCTSATAHSTGHAGNLWETASHLVSQPSHLLAPLACAAALIGLFVAMRSFAKKH